MGKLFLFANLRAKLSYSYYITHRLFKEQSSLLIPILRVILKWNHFKNILGKLIKNL